jgi:hypothetical protein
VRRPPAILYSGGKENESTPVPGYRLLPALALTSIFLALFVTTPPAVASDEHLTSLSTPTAALTAGDLAVIRADGDCLRLREAPGLGGGVLNCLAEGSIVTALSDTTTRDGFIWRKVATQTQHGWVAERYLTSASSTTSNSATCGAMPANSVAAGISGGIPPDGGISLLVWGGGTAEGLRDTAAERGCKPRSVWATGEDGVTVGYIFGAPSSVNHAWLALFPGGRIPAPRA